MRHKPLDQLHGEMELLLCSSNLEIAHAEAFYNSGNAWHPSLLGFSELTQLTDLSIREALPITCYPPVLALPALEKLHICLMDEGLENAGSNYCLNLSSLTSLQIIGGQASIVSSDLGTHLVYVL